MNFEITGTNDRYLSNMLIVEDVGNKNDGKAEREKQHNKHLECCGLGT